MDAHTFAPISLPPMLDLAHSAYTVLDSVTRAVFLHVTTKRAHARAQWGDIIKSNSNGTYFALSLRKRLGRQRAAHCHHTQRRRFMESHYHALA